jgi:hypothetical protein
MNATQRKFLIERIQQKVKERIEFLRKTLLQYPSASNYIFKAVLNEKLELQPKEVILDAIKKKALNAKEGENWLSELRMGYEKEREIKLLIHQLIVLPEDYKQEMERVRKHNQSITEEMNLLKIQLDTIEVRIQLASDKTLQNLVNEVDDMGSLSLIDTKLKLISTN